MAEKEVEVMIEIEPEKGDKYEVETPLTDTKDNNKVYKAGERYPKPANKKVSDERLKELLNKMSKNGTHFIKKIQEDEQK